MCHDIVTFTSFSTELYLNIHKWHPPHGVGLCAVYNSEKSFCLCTCDSEVLLECKFLYCTGHNRALIMLLVSLFYPFFVHKYYLLH